VTAYDLNPGINYALLPNPTAQANALAQPTAIVFAADGAHCWVAAFNSDRVAKVSSAGAVLARVDVRPVSANGSREMRGPRGLVLGMDGSRLFVLNKLSNTITTVDTASATVLAEVAAGSHDPMPQNIREGRGLLFDARLSGNGTGSCAICHIDSDRDGLAWDLGDPGGAMITVIGYNNSAHDTTTPRNRVMHPMKGPMTTQTLRGMKNPPNTPSNIPAPIFHWRGDRPTLQSFDVTFRDLMAGSLPPAPDMNVMADYLFSLLLHPNPFRGLNRALPATFQTSQGSGNPNNGRLIYLDHALSHCVTCHPLPTGSDQNIDIPGEVGSTQPVKTVHLRTVYQRSGFSRNAGAVNISGFGLLKDGTGNEFAIAHPYSLQQFETAQEFRDLEAFVHCFDTGVAPAVGHAITVTTLNRTSSTVLADLTTMEGQAVSNCNLVARGSISGKLRHYLYSPTPGNYSSDDITEPAITRTALLALLGAGDAITFTGVLAGEGARASTDRNANGTRNAQEAVPWLNCDMPSGILRLEWPASAADWYPETSATLQPPWLPLTTPRTTAPGVLRTEPASALPSGFYRLRRAW
jgi:YVTN family beta-propeller protein